MWKKLLSTPDDRVMALLRIVLAVVVFAHGAQKMLGWFGGFGPSGTYGFLTGMLHIPAPLALLVFAAEFFAPIGLLFGLMGRVAAFGIAVDFAVASILGGHIHNGFLMNWSGQQKGEGVEFFVLAIGIAIAVMIRGSGAWSLDRLIAGRNGGAL
ncbi:MAG: DoxX family protein [Gemmatimonadales bacterium]